MFFTKSPKSYLETPREFIEERKSATVRLWAPGMRDQRPPATTCTLPKGPEMHEEHSGLLAGWFPGKEICQARFWKGSIPGLSCRWAILGLDCWDTHGPQPQHPSALLVRPYASRNKELITPQSCIQSTLPPSLTCKWRTMLSKPRGRSTHFCGTC